LGLILRELASRGELNRALMAVPAGLVNNWHHELNEVFNLNFEVFGSEGDITDRKSNAFAKHDLLIASIDTLKRPARIKRLLEAPRWDLVVFDEAHHLTAYRNGNKVTKTANYKLSEALKNHARDLILLSATPHQGNHFRFWMLIQILNPTLFNNVDEMLEHRHRLNSVIFRRTKADACKSDGSQLFARRWVHTESFLMGQEERHFYERLREYLQDGFDLARRQGNQGRALGFLMAIFQKIAASSFAAVSRTLTRRLLMLTISEGIIRDREMDIEGRERLFSEARELIQQEFSFSPDAIGRSEVDRALADLKYRLVKRFDLEELELASDPYGSEYASTHAEEIASNLVNLHLPEERNRIRELLASFPRGRETKVQKLLDGLGALWRQNSNEKVVIFATYLGTVDLLAREIESVYPGQGVVILRGGDHGAKVAAERRFRKPDGPRVMVCTAAGREGINLQFARILFNFDLPWNPMDIEQRIGRIHRYGQSHTAQVYNLVLSDTIEGRIFLMPDDKLNEIARTLGKVDEQGNVAEDLRSQILGQLSERLNYDRLYQEAITDPELRRTRLELEAALSTASEARKVVSDVFQDLEGFSLDDYQPFSDVSSGMERLVDFISTAIADSKQRVTRTDDSVFEVFRNDGNMVTRFTTDRDLATSRDDLDLLGLDHPMVQELLNQWRSLPPEEIGIAVRSNGEGAAVLSFWLVDFSTSKGERKTVILPIAVRQDGGRMPSMEHHGESFFQKPLTSPVLMPEQRENLFTECIEPSLQRELRHKGLVSGDGSYAAELIGWIEIV
jgi:superfamily II DNA or RNA helicase